MGDTEVFLAALLSSDNATRNSAEAALKEARKDPLALVRDLVATMSASENVAHRQLCSVLLRRLLNRQKETKAEIWDKFSPENQSAIRDHILATFGAEPSQKNRRSVCELVAELAVATAGEGCKDWPVLIPSAQAWCQSEDATMRTDALFLLQCLAETGGGFLLEAHAELMKGIVGTLLQDADTSVGVGAIKTATALLIRLGDDEEEKIAYAGIFSPCFPYMFAVLEATLQGALTEGAADSDEQEEKSREALKSLVQLATDQPLLIREHLELAASAMLAITDLHLLEEETRLLGLEFLQALAESAGSSVRKVPELIARIMEICLGLLSIAPDTAESNKTWVESEDDPGSYLGDETEDEENLTAVLAGAQTIDRLAGAIGGKIIVPMFFETQWTKMSTSAKWQDRRAVILALSLIGEGCKRVMGSNIRQYVEFVVPFLGDAHPRVRHAAVRCLGQFASDFASEEDLRDSDNAGQVAESIMRRGKGEAAGAGDSGLMSRSKEKSTFKYIHDEAGELLLQSLTAIVANAEEIPRVRGVACSALVNVLNPVYAMPDIFGIDFGLAGPLLQALFELLSGVQEQYFQTRGYALKLIANVASVMEENFVMVYDQIMPALKAVVETPCKTKNDDHVRMCALECLSSVCQASGKQKSGIDAVQCLRTILTSLQESATREAEDDAVETTGSLPVGAGAAKSAEERERDELEESESYRTNITSLVRIAGTLGSDFAGFLDTVASFLLPKAARDITFTVTDAGDRSTPAAMSEAAKAAEKEEADEANLSKSYLNVAGLGRRKVMIDSHSKESKITALTGLMQMLMDNGEYIQCFVPLVDVLLPLLCVDAAFVDLRIVAADSVWHLLRVALANQQDPGHGQRVLDKLIPFLLSAVNSEFSLAAMYMFAEALCDVFELAYKSTLPSYKGSGYSKPASVTEDEAVAAANGAAAEAPRTFGKAVIPISLLPAVFSTAVVLFETCIKRRKMAADGILNNPDADEEEQEKLASTLEDEDDFVQNVTDTVGYCLKTHGAAALPYLMDSKNDKGEDVKGLLTFLLQFVGEEEPFFDVFRASSLCLFVDSLEFASPDAHQMIPTFLPEVQACAKHKNAHVRQPAVYGLGVLAQYGGDSDVIVSAIPAMLQLLGDSAMAQDARSDENGSVTDNSMSALLKFARYRPTSVDVDGIMTGLLAYLPFKHDDIEAREVHGQLIHALATADPLWLGADSGRAQPLLEAIARCLRQHAINNTIGENAEEGEEEDPLLLFEETGAEGSLEELKAVVEQLKTSAMAGPVAAVVASMGKNLRKAMTDFGFPCAE